MPVARREVEGLDVRVFDSLGELAEEAAAAAAATIGAAVAARGRANAMFATGNSQLAFVDALMVRRDVAWDRVVVFHMDEYVGVGADHPAGFRRWIAQRIVGRAVPTPLAAHYLDGEAEPGAECVRYAALLRANPLDLCCLGIGENGHLAFNDPPVADFADPADVKVVELDLDCRRQQVGEGHFSDVAAVPTNAITVTVPALLRARTVLAVVPEVRKAAPVRRALEGPVETACPASALRTHGDAHLFLDAGSASALTQSG